MIDKRSKERFSHTIEYYIKYRPSYPIDVIYILEDRCGFTKDCVVADIGSGTGIFSKLLLDHGNFVIGIEPNIEMQEAAEKYLSKYSRFTSINASAEETMLEDSSVDFVTVAQAFHWFDREAFKKEVKRILKPGGWTILLWNLRDNSSSEFMQAYEMFLQKFGIDYPEVCAENLNDDVIQKFFSPNSMEVVSLINQQTLDWEGFKGRLMSTSYIPKPDHPNFDRMLSFAKSMFDRYQKKGKIQLIYKTKLYLSCLGGS